MHNILLVMGYLNAKVEEDNEGYEHIIGSQGVGESHGVSEKITITGTIFPHKLIRKQTWTSRVGRKKKSNRLCVSEQATPDISNVH